MFLKELPLVYCAVKLINFTQQHYILELEISFLFFFFFKESFVISQPCGEAALIVPQWEET